MTTTADPQLPVAAEADRVAVLDQLGVLDSGPQTDLDAVVALARAAIGLPGAAVNFLDEHRQYQAASASGEPLHCRRRDSMCDLPVRTGTLVHAPDTEHDPRYAGNPFVTGRIATITTYAGAPVRSGGVVVGTVCVFGSDEPRELDPDELHTLQLLADQTGRLLELRRLARGLQDVALQDELTGLPNRRALTSVAEAVATGGVRTLAYLDLDGFKAVNDVGGHHVGDHVLRVVARRLRELVRGPDEVLRMGGDEFLVVCGGAVPEAELLSRLAAAVAEPVVVDGRAWRVGLSAGCTTTPVTEPVADAVRRADGAMYAAKTARRRTPAG